MRRLRLRQLGLTYRACGPFRKHLHLQKFRETGDLKYIYKNELDKACFAHYAANVNCEDLDKKTVSDNILKDRAGEITLNPKYNGYQRGLARMVYKIFD